MTINKEDFSQFGKSFQEKLACLILNDRSFSEQVEEVLETNFFEYEHLRIFAELIFNYRHEYGVHPSSDTLETILATELQKYNEEDREMVLEFFEDAEQKCGKIGDAEFIKNLALDFCKKRKLYGAMVKSIDLLEKKKFDEIKYEIEEALKLGNDNNCGHDYKIDLEERYLLKARSPVTTGWSKIDEITQGGLGKGELGVIIAGTGAGKSIALAHLSAKAVSQGKTVLYYTFELAEETVGLRHDSWFTGVSLNELKIYKETVKEIVKEVEGELIVKYYPTKTASLMTLRNHIEKIKRLGKNIDLIIVDYGDLLQPPRTRNRDDLEYADIYEGLRGIAGENKCPLWTASQSNRGGRNAEIVTMDAVADSYAKCFCADFIFSISRTIQDKETKTGRFFIAKNRNGPDAGIYPIVMDPEFVKIRVLEPSGQSVQDMVDDAAGKQQVKMKQKLSTAWQRVKNNDD